VADHRGQLDAALSSLEKALPLLAPSDEKRAKYILYKAQLLRRSGRQAEAINLLTALPEPQQHTEAVTEELASSFLERSEPARAATAWAKLFAVSPTNARAAAEAGLCLVQAGDLRQARRYLSWARNVDPRHARVGDLSAMLAEAETR
jgi:tetratricopeptide (TPR) repeat protein